MNKISNQDRQRLVSKYGQLALVTGASSGIGRALCHQLAHSDFNLIVVGRNEKSLINLQSELQAKYAVNLEIIVADLSQESELDRLIHTIRHRPIGIAILSAGYGTSGNFVENNIADELNMLDVNCKAVSMLSHSLGKKFIEQGFGGLILLGSIVSFQGVPHAAHYAATKAYVLSLGEALHHELKPLKVDVLTACPGPVLSGFGTRANMIMNKAMKPDEVAAPILKALGRRSVSLPGLLTKVLTYVLRTLPRWIKVLIMKKIMSDMTKHQNTIAYVS